LSIERVRSSPKRITPRAFCATDSLIALIASTAFTTDSISRNLGGPIFFDATADHRGRPFDSEKGIRRLIRTCALLLERGKSFRCEIIGEGRLRTNYEGKSMNCVCKIMSNCPAQNHRRNSRRIAAANVFVLPSVIDPDGGMDNLPTVIMEAMATGLPVVSTNIGGIPEMIIENETGFLVQPSDRCSYG